MVDDSELIDTVYAVSIDPQRFDDLVTIWVERIGATLDAAQGFESKSLDLHLQRSMEMIDLLMASQGQADSLPPATRGTDQPLLTFDVRGNLVTGNVPAHELYGLALGSPIEALPFDAQTHLTLRGGIIGTLQSGTQSADGPQVPSELIRAVRTDNGQTVLMTLALRSADAQTVDVRTADLVWPERLTQILQDSFGLTLAEADIGRQLVAGLSIAEIAASRSRAVDTVRTQLRSLYAKTATTSQTEFVRMALGLAALYPAEVTKPSGYTHVGTNLHSLAPAFPREDQRHLLELTDGRKMEYAIFGAKQGRVCLYVHEAMFGIVWPKRMAKDAARRGLTVVAPMRALWGRTDRYPADADVFEQFAQDVVQLLETLDMRDVVVLSRAIGSAYAYQIVAHAPERFCGLVGAAPGLPIEEQADLKKMMSHQRLLTGAIRHNRLIVRFMASAIEAFYRRYGLKKLLAMVYRKSPADLAALEDPMVMAAMEQGANQAAEQGISAFYNDFKVGPKGAWGGEFSLPVPMHCLIGEQDPNGRLARAQRLVEQGADIQVTLVPAMGDFLLYRAPSAVLDAVEDMFGHQTRVSSSRIESQE